MSPPLPLSYPDGDDVPLAGTAGGRNLPLLQTSVPVLVVQSPRCRQLCHSRPRTPRSGGCARSHGREIHRRKLPAKWSLASFSHSLVTAWSSFIYILLVWQGLHQIAGIICITLLLLQVQVLVSFFPLCVLFMWCFAIGIVRVSQTCRRRISAVSDDVISSHVISRVFVCVHVM